MRRRAAARTIQLVEDALRTPHSPVGSLAAQSVLLFHSPASSSCAGTITGSDEDGDCEAWSAEALASSDDVWSPTVTGSEDDCATLFA